MSRERAVLQTFWHVDPAQAILVQNERRITWNRIKTFGAYLALVIGSFPLYKSGNIDAGPFFRVPPDQFFPFAPGMTVRPRTGAVIDDAAIAGPRKAPAVTKVIFRFARVGLVYAIAAKNTGVHPAAARGRTVGFQFSKTIYLRTMMRFSIAIVAENSSVTPAGVDAPGYRLRAPAIDFREHGFHLRIAQVIFWIPPIQRA